ncbi:MAG TPA: phage capsid protein [Bacillota bacterium]|nr:phage capsid protein [Bacillota bacterium]
MAYTIPEIFHQKFATNIEAAIQQTSSVLDSTVTPFNFDAKSKSILIGTTIDWADATDGRMAQTNIGEYNATQRWVVTEKVMVPVAPALDEWDESLLDEITSPGSDIINAITYGYNRIKEKKIIAAVESAVSIGANAPTSTEAFPADNIISHGDAGLTFAKVAKVVRLAREQDVNPAELTWVISAKDEENLIVNVNEVRSKDYTKVAPIEGGSVVGSRWMGFTWIVSNQLTTDTTNHTVNSLVYGKQAIRFNFGSRKSAIETRPDRNGAIQFRSSARMGGARAQDKGVFIVKNKYATIA